MGTIKDLRFWAYKILPLVYDNSLSYYEVLSKVTQKLNEVITATNTLPELVSKEVENQLNGSDDIVQNLFGSVLAAIADNEGEATYTANAKEGGELIWLNGILYEVVAPMAVGTNYVVDSNIVTVSIADELAKVKKDIAGTSNEYYNTRSATSYSIGSYLYWKDVLYKATKAIATNDILYNSGDNQNLEEVDIGSELSNIQAQVDSNDTDISNLQTKDTELQRQITNNNNTLNTRIDNIVAQSSTDNTEVVDARLGAEKLGSETFDSLGAAIRGQIKSSLTWGTFNYATESDGSLNFNNLNTVNQFWMYNSGFTGSLSNAPTGFSFTSSTSMILNIAGDLSTGYIAQYLFPIVDNLHRYFIRWYNPYSSSWGSWLSFPAYFNHTTSSNTINLNSYNELYQYYLLNSGFTGTLSNAPSNFALSGTTSLVVNEGGVGTGMGKDYLIQYLYPDASNKEYYYYRIYNVYSSSWGNWISKPYAFNGNLCSNANTLTDPNGIWMFNSSIGSISNYPDDFTISGTTMVVNNGTTLNGTNYIIQRLYPLADDLRYYYYRIYNPYSKTWGNWQTIYAGNHMNIGTGTDLTTLRNGIANAMALSSEERPVIVHVQPGDYDLAEEFGINELTSAPTSQIGIAIGNGIHIIFESGANITAINNHTDSDIHTAINTYFSPFYSTGSFTLENLNITAQDVRYCVHDEHGGSGTYISKFINCFMHNTVSGTSGVTYQQCIGGGLAQHSYVYIDGGWYRVDSSGTYGHCITYHNGIGGECLSTIYIRNVFLANNGIIRMGYYGSSTDVSHCFVSGCRMAANAIVTQESSSYSSVNIDVTQWNNTIVPISS